MLAARATRRGTARASQEGEPSEDNVVMLRITEVVDVGPGLLLKLEGKLRQPWVEELARAAGRPLPKGHGPIRLDLSSVTFADEAGVRLLRELLRQGVEIAAASAYVGALLRLEE
jgi:ABC-type transporter Mla MlaB component